MKVKLYKQFEHWYRGGNIWVYSDPHFSSFNQDISKEWPNDEDHVKMINRGLGKNDTIIFLGDVVDPNPIKQIKGYKVLIMGNHDRGASNYCKMWHSTLDRKILFQSPSKEECEAFNFEYFMDHMTYPSLENNKLFDEVYEGPLFISDRILLSHEPINLPFGYNVHGHCHRKELVTGVPGKWMSFNVAADVVGFQKQRLDKLVQLGKVEDLHRQAIDRQRRHCDL